MKLVSGAEQVRELDRVVIEDIGVPGIALMELASRAVAMSVRTHHAAEAARGVLVVCGGGNNGGDGYGVARWLHGWGFPVSLLSLYDTSRGDAAVMRAACQWLGIPEVAGNERAGLLVDAVFGTGLSRTVSGRHAEILRTMAAHPAPVVAIDLPSGLCADTGQVLGVCLPAVRTVTFGRLKPGLLTAPGIDLAGEVEIADIGLDAGTPDASRAVAEVPEPADLAPLWPRRHPGDHKTRSGHVLVLAGSTWMAGAAVLACRGAFAAGAGVVSVAAPRGALPRLAALPPTAMVLDGGPGDQLTGLAEDLDRFSAIGVGPGLGGGQPLADDAVRWLQDIWAAAAQPAVFDADALVCTRGMSAGPRVITPHAGEAARLLDLGVAQVEADRFGAVAGLAQGRVALLKGRNTLIAAPGHRVSVNPTNTPVLGTAGSGDVLTGVLAALLSRGVPARDAARLAAWVHGRAGEILADIRVEGWTAEDLADALPDAIGELTSAPPSPPAPTWSPPLP